MDGFFSLIGRLTVTLALIAALLLGAMLGYSEISLSEVAKTTEFDRAQRYNANFSVIYDEASPTGAKRYAVLNEYWPVRGQYGDKELFFPVSARYVTDFASVPVFLHWLVQPFGRNAEPAILHDWMYAVGGTKQGARKFADEIYYAALIDVGTPVWLARLNYTAARWFAPRNFGNPEEWARFYDPAIDGYLEEQCIIAKPDLDLENIDVIRIEWKDVLTPFGQERPFTLKEFAVRDPYFEAWREALTAPDCLDFLLSAAMGQDPKTEAMGSIEDDDQIISRLIQQTFGPLARETDLTRCIILSEVFETPRMNRWRLEGAPGALLEQCKTMLERTTTSVE